MKSFLSQGRNRVGFGVVPIQPVLEALEKRDKKFLSHFTEHEKAYCARKRRGAESFAARRAAKEAFWDALDTKNLDKTFRREAWQQIEVVREKPGPPALKVHPSLLRKVGLPASSHFLLSLTHEREFAMAALIIDTSLPSPLPQGEGRVRG